LGVGGESRVYALGKDQVLRIYHRGDSEDNDSNTPWDYVDKRRAFYEELSQHHLSIALPEVLSVNSWVGHIYTVEKRMPGQDFAKVLPTLRGADRAKALTSYLDVAAQLGTVRFPDRPFGELLVTDQPVQCERWSDYLRTRLQNNLAGGRTDLEQDVPDLDVVLAMIEDKLSLFDDYQEKCLVHGDYYPINLFIDDTYQICGVGDFGYTTLVGDRRMDLAGALLFIEVLPDYCADDSAFLQQQLTERWGDSMLEIVDFYRLYYSIFFSGCKADDPATYWWCVGNLRRAPR
jgi:aminoglycoside phosphotransferase (APT) family kinase protein